MCRKRITGVILALGTALLGSAALAVPASAHPGATVFSIKLGVTTPLFVLVPADYGKPIDRVDIADAPGFTLTGASAPDGWTMVHSGNAFTFTGGTIVPGPGTLFTIRGTPTVKGMLIFPVTTHSPDGTTKLYDGGPTSSNAGVVVYVGTAAPGRPFPWKAVGGGVLAAAGLAGTGIIMRRAAVARRDQRV